MLKVLEKQQITNLYEKQLDLYLCRKSFPSPQKMIEQEHQGKTNSNLSSTAEVNLVSLSSDLPQNTIAEKI